MAGTFSRQFSMMIALPPITTTTVRGFPAAIGPNQLLVLLAESEARTVPAADEPAPVCRGQLAHEPAEGPQGEGEPQQPERLDVRREDPFALVPRSQPHDHDRGVSLLGGQHRGCDVGPHGVGDLPMRQCLL